MKVQMVFTSSYYTFFLEVQNKIHPNECIGLLGFLEYRFLLWFMLGVQGAQQYADAILKKIYDEKLLQQKFGKIKGSYH